MRLVAAPLLDADLGLDDGSMMALLRGVPMVTTSTASHLLGLVNGTDVLCADTVEGFAQVGMR